MLLETADGLPLSGEPDVLTKLSHAFASTEDPVEARTSTLKWAKASIGPDVRSVRLFLVDTQGRLRLAAGEGDRGSERKGAARRRSAFESRICSRHGLTKLPGHEVGMLPLVSRGEAVGLLEVVAPAEVLERSWSVVEAVAAQAAIVFRNIGRSGASRGRFAGLRDTSALAGDLIEAGTVESAARIAARFCWDTLRIPVAVWVVSPQEGSAKLIAAYGLGARKRSQVRAELGSVPAGDLAEPEGPTLPSRFAALLEEDEAVGVRAGQAILVAAKTSPVRDFLEAVGSLLEQILGHLQNSARVKEGVRRLDTGLAWAAHEIRGPLVGLRAALQHAIEEPTGPKNQEWLKRSIEELERLIVEFESQLTWAMEGGPLKKKQANLTHIVTQAARSSELEFMENRVRVLSSDHVMVRASVGHLRSAIANVIRNALAYSPTGTVVDVSVHKEDHSAIVSVSDRGSGVIQSESHSIFDPFVRGRLGDSGSGAGLGLFIARRVVEAHDGSISVVSNGQGATFLVRLPAHLASSDGRRVS